MITLRCHHCGKTLQVSDAAAGGQARCPLCRTLTPVKVPAGGQPPKLPHFYPGLDDRGLAEFLTDEDYEAIKAFDDVYILPLASSVGAPDQVRFGRGLARLLMRNLMLLRDVSIHGPEDTPDVTYESAPDHVARRRRSGYVTGVAGFGRKEYTLRFEVNLPGRPRAAGEVRRGNFADFVWECSAAVGRALGSGLRTCARDVWQVGQPRDAWSLVDLGDLGLRFGRTKTRERSRAARNLLADDPDFAVPAWDLDEDTPRGLRLYLKALRRDPYNAQLCFLTFCAVWHSRGPQPEAVQFCRRAIELSPGHGKAHMCAPHAAPREADMLRHSELGYRLLPGNAFAINNYILNLTRRGAPDGLLLKLAAEGINTDPHDPTNYERMIELLRKVQDYRAALAVAERLQRLFEPVMDERALYCLRQNPERARLLRTGQYDPAAENRRRIATLRQLAAGESGGRPGT